MDDKRLKKIKTSRGIRKYSKSESIRLSYLCRMRGAEGILDKLYGGIVGPRRQNCYIKNIMRKRLGICTNRR